jgi:endonuclease YncB( thermonuclease family)
VWAGLAGGVLGILIVLFAAPAELFGRVPVLTGTMTAPAPRVAVVDGETLLLNETIIRLFGVSAPARGQACDGEDGKGMDCGAAAAAALAGLVRGRDVSCRLAGRDGEGFARGVCEAAGTELNRAQVVAGWARVRGEAQGLDGAEAAAKAARRGLWRSLTP